MQLSELNPKITESGFLVFDCPCSKCGGRIRVPLHPAQDRDGQSWSHSGNLENITLQPSVNAGCWHGFISNGQIS